jgi:hypothetical protein
VPVGLLVETIQPHLRQHEKEDSHASRLLAVFCATALALALAVPAAYAFDCSVAKKPAEAGSAVVVDITTGDATPLKPNPGTEEQTHGGFIELTDGEFSTSTFAHAPDGVLPPVREGGPQHNCDGKGLDSLEECFGE